MRRRDHPNQPHRHFAGVGAAVDIGAFQGNAIACACQHKGTSWRSIQFVSDQANGDAPADWQANVRRGKQLFVPWLIGEVLAHT